MTKERLQELEKALVDLDSRRTTLLSEISSLRSSVATSRDKKSQPTLIGRSTAQAVPITPEDKIDLFLKLFRCREDVYPKRWENTKTNKQGYSPTCDLEWVKPICQKPVVKCSECPHQCIGPRKNESLGHLKVRGQISSESTARLICSSF